MARTLVIETATAASSVALVDSGRVIASIHEVVGRGHAERLVPMIAELPDRGRADLILVDCGPGSFTGIRVGIAAARGLGLGWGVPVRGFSSLPLVAASAFAADPTLDRLAVVLEGGHGEVFVQLFAAEPDMRRGGVGAALLRSVIADCANRGIASLHLEVRDGNDAIKLYRNAGFSKVGERRDYYRGADGRNYSALTLRRATR